MNDYSEFPPLAFFKRILNSSPSAALLYASLWEYKTASNRVAIKRQEIKKDFLISPTLFRNHLLSMCRLELLTFEETTDFFLMDFYENDDN